ncbi:hypothetical protein [Kitasatospora viridis]|uniref:Uncharacterized protein n=1 Tax=Kitasatospora viridis TaxID=281105 RepID=A0A561S9T1_9ACTN|nr:hypothetical protein [Kitasatospora viridis]TWF71631.1 hypothetical protein FHX73_182 [Kitasatospora viridis]
MERCHLYLPLVDSTGQLYPYAQVSLLDTLTGQPVSVPVYSDPVGGSPLDLPVLCAPAVVNLWTDLPMRVTVLVTFAQNSTLTLPNVDIPAPPDGLAQTEVPIKVTAPGGVTGSSILASGNAGTATWQAANAFASHQHSGDAPDSVVLGSLDPTDYAPRQVWIGNGAGAGVTDQGIGSVAVGHATAAHGEGGTAIGSAAAAQALGLAVGAGAQAGPSSTVLGASSLSGAASQVLIGRQLSATAPEAIVIGSGVTATSGLSLGPGLRSDLQSNLLLGSAPVPDTGDWPGPFLHLLNNTVVPWYLNAPSDVMLGGAGANLSVWGAPGAFRAVIFTEGATGAVASLVQALDGLGLIYSVDNSTFTDDFTDLSKVTNVSSNLVIESGATPTFDNRPNHLKRQYTDTPSSFTYTRPSALKDFALVMYVHGSSTVEGQLALTLNGTTPFPLSFTNPVATANAWSRVWVFGRRSLPAGTTQLTFTLQGNPEIFSPAIAKVWLR